MPGIFGAYKSTNRRDISGLADRMTLAIRRDQNYRSDRMIYEDKGLFLCRLSLGVLNPIDQPITDAEGKCSIVFHGELYGNDKQLNDPQYVLSHYMQEGYPCFRDISGVFHCAIYDATTHKLRLISDKFGLQPLYYTLLPDGIVFAGEVKGLLEDPGVSREPDFESFADFLHYGQILGDKTLFRNIKLLPPGSVLTYDCDRNKVSLDRYWRLENVFAEKGAYDQRLDPEEVVSLLVDSMRKRTGNRDILGISLSAGLDSRGILAGIGDNARGIHTYTLGLPGCTDERLAALMARAAETQHEFIPLDNQYLSNFEKMASSMIIISDGMYHPHEFTEMLALEYFKRAQFRVLLRGHGGEIAKAALAHPVMATPAARACKSPDEILNFIFKSTNLIMRDIDPKELFSPFFQEYALSAPREDLKNSCGRASERLAPADTCIFYYITEHIRRQVVASLDIFRTQIEIRMPYIDENYIEKLLKLPVRERNEGEIQLRLIKKCMPSLIKIPNSNTGAPLDAGPLRLFFMDKFSSLMKRFSVSGFRHYTEFNKWQRDAFKEVSRQIIFHEKTRGRNLYNMEYLEQVFNAHMSGTKNYGRLLGTIIGLELWYRSFVD